MKHDDEKLHGAALMAAAADLLMGEPGHAKVLNESISIMAGPAPNMATLLHWGDWVRQGHRPILLVTIPPATPHLPMVTLVEALNGHSNTFERCYLWLSRDGGRARIVPDSFKSGSYVVGENLDLTRLSKPPLPNLKHAKLGIVRASVRLHELAAHHRSNPERLMVPAKLRERMAA
jgi:hypothetical protein